MDSLLDLLDKQLSAGTLSKLSGQLGVGEEDLARAVPSVVAMLTGSLARNAAQPDGAQALAAALERDHDGSILDLDDPLQHSHSKALDGDGILRHVLGGRQQLAQQMASRASGLDGRSVARVMAALAPLVMGALGRMQRQRGLDPEGLAGMLGQERRRLERSAPSGLGGVLTQLLDADGDGSMMDDVARLGSGLLGGLFGGRR